MTTDMGPATQEGRVAGPDEGARADRRLGWQIGLVTVVAAIAVLYVGTAALPAAPYQLPFISSTRTVSLIVPEGWAFFTRSPRAPEPQVYAAEGSGGWRAVSAGPLAVPDTLMGLDRTTRSQGTEIAILIYQVPRTAWTACTGPPTRCLSAAHPTTTVVNGSTHRTVCGDIGIVYQEVTPWAWHELRPVMPSQVVRVEVRC
jgi:antimicrobial peptide system SdpA family protein